MSEVLTHWVGIYRTKTKKPLRILSLTIVLYLDDDIVYGFLHLYRNLDSLSISDFLKTPCTIFSGCNEVRLVISTKTTPESSSSSCDVSFGVRRISYSFIRSRLTTIFIPDDLHSSYDNLLLSFRSNDLSPFIDPI